MEHTGGAAGEPRGVTTRLHAVAPGLESPQRHGRILEEGREDAHGVGSATDACRHRVGQSTCLLEQLLARFAADHGLEGAHHRGEGTGPGHGAEDVVRLVNRGHPVAHRLVDRILECATAGRDGHDGGAEEPHARHVEGLATRVLLAHVDHAVQTEEGCGRGSGDAVLARARLRDDALLAHAHREQCLTQHVVDLVRSGVIEVFALKEDARAATVLLAEADSLGEGARATRVGALESLEFGMERRIRHRLREGRVETVERCGEGFGHETTAVGPEMALCHNLASHVHP